MQRQERHPAQLPTRAPAPQVWLQLEEKRIPYEIEKINMRCYGAKPRAFMEMVPSGLLPVMELNGRVIIESDAIMAALEACHDTVLCFICLHFQRPMLTVARLGLCSMSP
jgi:Glutathione S-transferase, N-terminal domain